MQKRMVRDFGGNQCTVCHKPFRDGTQSRRNMTAVRIETRWAHYHGYVCGLCVDFLAQNQVVHKVDKQDGSSRVSPKQTPTTAFGHKMTISKAKSVLIEAATEATASGELRQTKGGLWK